MNKTEFTKYCIANALFELLKVKDYHEISVKDIVTKAGFSRMSYYRNFNSLEETLHYFLDSQLDNLLETNKVFFEFKHINHAISLLSLALRDQKRREIDEVFVKQGLEHIIFENNRRQVLKHSPQNRLYADLFISGGFNEIWYHWVRGGHKESPEEVINLLREQISNDLKVLFEEEQNSDK